MQVTDRQVLGPEIERPATKREERFRQRVARVNEWRRRHSLRTEGEIVGSWFKEVTGELK
ncbi:MAG TPA: hypothetical protein VFH17_08015 [Coriobacteriia bacterium]|nr:hypothetical protein [Coriobacteriia bacterium]